MTYNNPIDQEVLRQRVEEEVQRQKRISKWVFLAWVYYHLWSS